MKRRLSLLFTVGIILVVVFLLSTFTNSREIRENYILTQTSDMNAQARQRTVFVRSEMYEYEALSWLLSYWQEHHAEMDIPIDGLKDAAWRGRHKKYLELELTGISEEEAASFTPKDQKEFAEVCYIYCADIFYRMTRDFSLIGLNCYMNLNDSEAFVFFSGIDHDRDERRYSLGQIWPMNLKLHPTAERIYKLGADAKEDLPEDPEEILDQIEHAVSTTDGIDYMFVYSPIIIDNKLRGMICEVLNWTEVHEEARQTARYVEIANTLYRGISYVSILLLIIFLLVRPLLHMQKAVHIYENDKNGQNVRENLGKLAKRRDELGALALSLADMTEEIDRYIEDIKMRTAEKERMGAELKMAADIQTSSLPHDFFALPQRDSYDIYATMEPAKEVGGDFYDFFPTDDDHLVLVVADVSGKGIPAALFMMTAKTIIRSIALREPSPEKILYGTNAAIEEFNEHNMFVTVWLGILEISSGKLTFADAGHERMALLQGGEWRLMEKVHTGFGLGLFDHEEALMLPERCRIVDQEVVLKPGDAIFQYTDGVTEASNSDKELFHEDRLLDALKSAPSASPKTLIGHVHSAIHDFVKDEPQFDDTTMLGMIYRP